MSGFRASACGIDGPFRSRAGVSLDDSPYSVAATFWRTDDAVDLGPWRLLLNVGCISDMVGLAAATGSNSMSWMRTGLCRWRLRTSITRTSHFSTTLHSCRHTCRRRNDKLTRQLSCQRECVFGRSQQCNNPTDERTTHSTDRPKQLMTYACTCGQHKVPCTTYAGHAAHANRSQTATTAQHKRSTRTAAAAAAAAAPQGCAQSD